MTRGTQKGEHLSQCAADSDVLGERLRHLRVDALVAQVPRRDLVGHVVAQRVEDGAPARCAEVVVAQVDLSQRAIDTQRVGDRDTALRLARVPA